MTIEYLRRQILEGKYSVAFTHTEKLRRRRISLETIEQVVASGEIIESYPDDPRGFSCLVFGITKDARPIHVVCGNLADERLLIITAYEPDPEEWDPDWKTRKRGGRP